MHRRLLLVLSIAALPLFLIGRVEARPEYAEKEKKECAFCHVNPNGGGERNWRGQYYGKNKTLKGLPAQFKLLWKAEVPADARRVALGDVLEEKKHSVLVLGGGEELSVFGFEGDELKKTESVALGSRAAQFFVARLQKGKPAMIAVPGAIFYRSGGSFAQVKAPGLTLINGAVRFVDGEECVFFFDGMSEPSVFSADVTAENPLRIGPAMVLPEQGAGVYSWVVARFPSEAIAALGWIPEVTKSPALGLWDPRGDENLVAWAVWTDKDGSRLVVVEPGAVMSGGDIKPRWSSDKFDGKVLDVTLGTNPKDNKTPGFLVLVASGEEGKQRRIEFWGLD